MPPNEVCPQPKPGATTSTTQVNGSNTTAHWHLRHAAAHRLPPLHCGCRDTWTCRCGDNPEPTSRQVDAYRDAATLLLSRGLQPAPDLPCLRALWRRGGPEQRLARIIAQQWEKAA